jgi:hypothetical protein
MIYKKFDDTNHFMSTEKVQVEMVEHKSNTRKGEWSIYVGSTCTKWKPAWQKVFFNKGDAEKEYQRLNLTDSIEFKKDIEQFRYVSCY